MKSNKKISVLFVCLGNICRSPAAEGIMKQIVDERGLTDSFLIDSAGIGDWHVGDLPDKRIRKHGAERGYDFCSRARQISMSDFEKFDYIMVMDEENFSYLSAMVGSDEEKHKIHRLGDYFSHHPNHNIVPDPYYGGERGFELVLDLLEDACGGFLDSITAVLS
jgi:protein-tyrosine phosphatase